MVDRSRVVYTVYVFKYDPTIKGIKYDKYEKSEKGSYRDRTWAWYSELADAEKAILENHTDMFEMGYYDHAVIECVHEGILASQDVVAWYRAAYSPETDETVIIHLDGPPDGAFEGTNCFAMG